MLPKPANPIIKSLKKKIGIVSKWWNYASTAFVEPLTFQKFFWSLSTSGSFFTILVHIRFSAYKMGINVIYFYCRVCFYTVRTG